MSDPAVPLVVEGDSPILLGSLWLTARVPGLWREFSPVLALLPDLQVTEGMAFQARPERVVVLLPVLQQAIDLDRTTDCEGFFLDVTSESGRSHLGWWMREAPGVEWEEPEAALVARACSNEEPGRPWTQVDLLALLACADKARAAFVKRGIFNLDPHGQLYADWLSPERLKLLGFMARASVELLDQWLEAPQGRALVEAAPVLVPECLGMLRLSANVLPQSASAAVLKAFPGVAAERIVADAIADQEGGRDDN